MTWLSLMPSCARHRGAAAPHSRCATEGLDQGAPQGAVRHGGAGSMAGGRDQFARHRKETGTCRVMRSDLRVILPTATAAGVGGRHAAAASCGTHATGMTGAPKQSFQTTIKR